MNLHRLYLLSSPNEAYSKFTLSDNTISIEFPPSGDGFLKFTDISGVIKLHEEIERKMGSSLTITRAEILIDPREHIGFSVEEHASFTVSNFPRPVPADQFVNPFKPIYQNEFFVLCSSGRYNPEMGDIDEILRDCQLIIEKQLWLGNRLCKFANVFTLQDRDNIGEKGEIWEGNPIIYVAKTITIGFVPRLMPPSKKRTKLVNHLIKLQENKLKLLQQLK